MNFSSAPESEDSDNGNPAGSRNGERPGAVLLLNRQRTIRADWDEVGTFLFRLSSQVARSGFSVCFLSDQGIRRYNQRFGGKDQATDVLSFPIEESGPSASSGSRAESRDSGPQEYLGDILISAETAQKNARRYGLRLEEEIKVLALHGVLHLLGYDHERDDGEMARLERRWSRKLGLAQNLTGRSRNAFADEARGGRPER